jgi:hypothetical protein
VFVSCFFFLLLLSNLSCDDTTLVSYGDDTTFVSYGDDTTLVSYGDDTRHCYRHIFQVVVAVRFFNKDSSCSYDVAAILVFIITIVELKLPVLNIYFSPLFCLLSLIGFFAGVALKSSFGLTGVLLLFNILSV